jgi:hypothetical protein
MSRTTPITKSCLNCGKDFLAKFQVGQNRHEVYCVRACYVEHKNRPEYRQGLFWAQVEKTPTCWLWKGWKLNSGYGETSLRGRKITVHRLSYIWAYGEIPKGKLIMHTCDEPLCVRPEHLRLGTDATNNADKVAKRRHTFGAANSHAKLDDAKVQAIRAEYWYRAGRSNVKELAEKYGVSRITVGFIVSGRTWRHLPHTPIRPRRQA